MNHDIEKLIESEQFDKALKLLENTNKNSFEYFYFKAEINRIKGFIKKAHDIFKKALKYAQKYDDKFKTFIRLASLSRALGDLNKSAKYLKLAEKINPSSVDFLIEKAMYLRLSEKYADAFKIFKKLKKIFSNEKDYSALAYILWAEGGIYRNMGLIDLSIKSFKNAIKYSNISKDPSILLYSKLGLAGSLRIKGEIKKSYNLYHECIKKSPSSDLFAKGYSLCGTANALRQLGRYKTALRYYRKALFYYKKIKDNPDTALVLWGMSECFKKIDLKKADKCLKEARKYLKNTHEIRGKILVNISDAHLRYVSGDIKNSKILFNKALELSLKHNLNTVIECFG